MINKYEDMLKMPHPVSKKHPRMSANDRAAQFSPFASLTGFEDLVDDKEKEQSRFLESQDIVLGEITE